MSRTRMGVVDVVEQSEFHGVCCVTECEASVDDIKGRQSWVLFHN